jgi:hypothetical protein
MNPRSVLHVCLIALALLAGLPRPASACPTCSEAVAAAGDGDESDGPALAWAYNTSIYLMVSVPYLALGTVSVLVYRGLKDKARAEELAAGPPQPADGGLDHVLSPESTELRP